MAHRSSRKRVATDYQIACICPMGIELAPVQGMLDEIHDSLPNSRARNAYTLGNLAGHDIVIAIMPEIGNNAAATTVNQLLNDFPAIQFGLLVGIGGGVPGKVDIRLGDVVVGQPAGAFPGVVQYDMGKEEGGQFRRIGAINKPPAVLSAHVRKLDGQHRQLGYTLSEHLLQMFHRNPNMRIEYSFPLAPDQLFASTYIHHSGSDCSRCNDEYIVARPPRQDNEPRIHYGTIGSANKVVKDAGLRDQICADTQALCVEMEAAGLMNEFPCLVIRGICDYADSHKNKEWQPYAAAVAASYMKTLLLILPDREVSLASLSLNNIVSSFKLGLHLAEAPVVDADFLVGRSTELEEMKRILRPNELPQEHLRLILGGMGGIGKTQLAIAYAKQCHHLYDSVFWLNGMSEIALKQSIRQLAQQALSLEVYQGLGTDDDDKILLHVTRWLSEIQNTRWLLIFDNYDEPDAYDIRKYCPHGSHGTAIITTRLPDQVQGQQLLVKSIEDIEQSLHILAKRSKRADVTTDMSARKLAKRMQGLPLALATAGAFLQKSTWTFERYLQEYEERWKIGSQRFVRLQEYQDRTLYTTWNVSFQRLENEDGDAARMLRLLAYFDNQHVWFELLHKGIGGRTPEWLVAVASSPATFEGIMRVLVEYCFVELHLTTQSYSIHTCVHDWALVDLNENIDRANYWYTFDCVANSVKGVDWKALAYVRYAQLAPHARRFTHRRFREVNSIMSPDRFDKATSIAQLLQQQVLLEAAASLLSQILAVKEKVLGLEHVSTLTTIHNLGRLCIDQGKLTEAETMYNQALVGMEKALGAKHVLTLEMANDHGNLDRKQGKLLQADQMYTRALAGMETLLGSDHILTIGAVNNLGLLYRDQCKLVQAEQMFKRALVERVKKLGAGHISTLDTVHNLGLLYMDQGKLLQTEQMYQQALTGYEKMLGPDHTSTLQMVNNLGVLYRRQGKLVEAEKMYQRALAGYESALGPEHTSTLHTVHALGLLYQKQGKLVEAEGMYSRALRNYEKALGLDHTSTLDIVHNLANLYAHQGRLVEAEQMYKRALAGTERALGPDHTSTLHTLHSLGLLLKSQKKPKEAEQMYQRALAGYEKALGSGHISTLSILNNMGVLFLSQGEHIRAEQMSLRAFGGYERALGLEHISTLNAAHNLGMVYTYLDRLVDAEKMYIIALDGREKALGPNHQATKQTVKNLGNLYQSQGRVAEAKNVFQRLVGTP